MARQSCIGAPRCSAQSWQACTVLQWLNDDVVVPLTLRLQNPAEPDRLVYLAEGAPQGWVSDVGSPLRSSPSNTAAAAEMVDGKSCNGSGVFYFPS